MTKPKVSQYGEHGILLNWSQLINDEVHKAVLAYQEWIEQIFAQSIQETNIGYQSLLVLLKTDQPMVELMAAFEEFDNLSVQKKSLSHYKYLIPVCYDSQFGIDLEDLANRKKLNVSEVIERHTSKPYQIYFTGFLPGFLYLGGLDPILHSPRHKYPRLVVPKGSVAIGGEQTGIYPQKSPGGWHILGQTPVDLFDANKQVPSIFNSGDYIQFYAISLAEFNDIKNESSANQLFLKREVSND